MKPFSLPFGLAPKPDTGGVRYADMYVRSVAAAIDLAILFYFLNEVFQQLTVRMFARLDAAALEQVSHASSGVAALRQAWNSGFIPLWLLNSGIQVAIIGVFFVGSQMLFATTPGKWLMGLKILRVGTDAAPQKWRYALRFAAYLPSMAPFMLGMIMASFNAQRRCLHDRIAGTVVIHTRPRNWLWHEAKAWVKKRRNAKTE